MDTNTPVPNLEELRRLRLAFLEGQTTAAAKRENGSDNDDKREEDEKDNVHDPQVLPHKRAKTGKSMPQHPVAPLNQHIKPEVGVIDLCDDDDDVDNNDNGNNNDETVIEVDLKYSDSVNVLENTEALDDNNGDDDGSGVVALATASSEAASENAESSLSNSSDLVSNWISLGRCFQLCTYNLWFGPERDGHPHPRARMRAVVDILNKVHTAQNPLWFVGFQEAVDLLSIALVPLIKNAQYKVFEQPHKIASFRPYGVALAIRQGASSDTCPNPEILEQGWVPYTTTEMMRGFLYARCRLPTTTAREEGRGEAEEECLVTNTHLESWTPHADGADVRTVQIQQLSRFCLDQLKRYPNLKTAIIMGDLNWDDESKRPNDEPLLYVLSKTTTSSNASKWQDVFQETNNDPKNKGYTYDSKLNPMMQGGTLRRRFDRCLVYRRGGRDVLCGTSLVGQEALPSSFTWHKLNTYTQKTRIMPTAPSDHFGLVSRLSLK